MNACDDLLLRHGGHAQAAGFACEPSVLPALTDRLQAIASEQRGDAVRSTDGVVDAEVDQVDLQPFVLNDLMGPTFQALRKMEPFGMGNPAPLFLTRGVEVQDARTMGAGAAHFRLTLVSDGAMWNAVAFKQGWVEGTTHVDIVYTFDEDHWNGKTRQRLTVKDYAPSSMQPRLAL